MIRCAGIDVPRAPLARLAVTLHHGSRDDKTLAHLIGVAIDKNWDELRLDSHERTALLAALENPPPGLEELRDRLQGRDRELQAQGPRGRSTKP